MGREMNTLMKVSKALTVKINGKTYSSLTDRANLRNELLNDYIAAGGSVQFNKKFVKYVETLEKVEVHFEDGSTEEGDILIGADGARSAVRAQRCPELIPPKMPIWTNAGTIELTTADTSKLQSGSNNVYRETLTALTRAPGVEGISWMSLHDGLKSRILWSLSMPIAVATEAGLTSPGITPESTRDILLRLCREKISPQTAELLQLTAADQLMPGYEFTSVEPGVVKSNPLGRLSSSRVTLAGDAAHKTTTQAGLGATAALMDAVSMAKCLIASSSSSPSPSPAAAVHALRKYEREMSRRAAGTVSASRGNSVRIHDTDPTHIRLTTAMQSVVGGGFRLAEAIGNMFK